MTKTNEAAASSRPLVRWGTGVGLVVLALSLAAASLAMKPSDTDAPNGSGTTPPAPGKRAVAVARVDVEGGVTRSLYPVRHGRVVSVPFREGEPIKEGAVLLRIDDTQARLDLSRAEYALELSREKLTQARILVKKHKTGLGEMQAAVTAAQKAHEKAKAVEKKARRLFEEKLGGASAEDVEAAAAQVAEAEAGVRAKQKGLDRLMLDDPEGAVRAANLDIKDKEKLVELARLAIAEHEVKAPYEGTMLRLGVGVGDVLGPSPKMPIMEYCRAGPRIVRAEVEQEFASLVREGQKATMIDDATGGDRWEGQVLRIGDWFAKRRGQLLEPMEFNDVLTLEVILAVKPGGKPLRIGQRLRVQLEGTSP